MQQAKVLVAHLVYLHPRNTMLLVVNGKTWAERKVVHKGDSEHNETLPMVTWAATKNTKITDWMENKPFFLQFKYKPAYFLECIVVRSVVKLKYVWFFFPPRVVHFNVYCMNVT